MLKPFIGKTPQVDDSNFIAENATVIGDVTLGEGASIWYQCTVRGDVNWIRIGTASNVQDNSVIHVTHETAPTDIGDYVTIGHGAIIHGCTIEDTVLIGMGATVMDHAVIGRHSIVGAGALVVKGTEVPPRSANRRRSFANSPTTKWRRFAPMPTTTSTTAPPTTDAACRT